MMGDTFTDLACSIGRPSICPPRFKSLSGRHSHGRLGVHTQHKLVSFAVKHFEEVERRWVAAPYRVVAAAHRVKGASETGRRRGGSGICHQVARRRRESVCRWRCVAVDDILCRLSASASHRRQEAAGCCRRVAAADDDEAHSRWVAECRRQVAAATASRIHR